MKTAADKLNTVLVNGVLRSRLNSAGLPIADTPARLKAFWFWFGNSTFTDEDGRPLVVFHGTKELFSAFDTNGRGKTSDTGAFFTDRYEAAETYGDVRAFYLRSGKNVAEVDFVSRPWNQGPIDCEAYDDEGEPTGHYDTMKEARAAVGPDAAVIDRALILNADGELEIDLQDETGTPPSTDSYAAQAREYGFDAFVAERVVDVRSGADTAPAATVYVVFDKDQIRSVDDFLANAPSAAAIDAFSKTKKAHAAIAAISKHKRKPAIIPQCA